MSKRIGLLLALCIASSTLLKAEEDDFGFWTYLGLTVPVNKIISSYSEAELRTRNDAGTVDCWALYEEISFRICPYLKAGAGYTFISYNHPTLSWESRHRLNGFITGNYSVGRWNFAVRERYEEVHRVLTDKSQPTPKAKRTLRSRFECNYKIPSSRFTPYSTVELYTSLNDPKGVINDKMRYTMGLTMSMWKKHSVSIYYRYIESFRKNSVNSHILGAGARFVL